MGYGLTRFVFEMFFFFFGSFLTIQTIIGTDETAFSGKRFRRKTKGSHVISNRNEQKQRAKEATIQ